MTTKFELKSVKFEEHYFSDEIRNTLITSILCN